MRKFSWILIAVVMLALGLSVGRLSAGSPDSPGAPNSPAAQMYTLEQIYQRLNNGTAGTKMTTFTEPDRKSTRLNSSHSRRSRMPSSA